MIMTSKQCAEVNYGVDWQYTKFKDRELMENNALFYKIGRPRPGNGLFWQTLFCANKMTWERIFGNRFQGNYVEVGTEL